MQRLLVFLLIGCLALPQLFCQERTPQSLNFPTLDTMERRGHVLQVREHLMTEIEAKKTRDATVQKLDATYNIVCQQISDKDKLIGFINLRKQVLEVIDELKDTTARQAELAGLIDSTMAAGGLLPQVQAYLNEARTQLHTMGIQQKSLQTRLERSLVQIKKAINSVPAPERFTNKSGIEMILIKSGKNAFYISSTPLNNGYEISLQQALRNTQDLSKREGILYKLPEIAELRILNQLDIKPDNAIWTLTPWESENTEENRMCERFGIQLYTVWDPNNVLGKRPTFGELPFASYPKLDHYVTTSAQTGWLARWNQLQIALSK